MSNLPTREGTFQVPTYPAPANINAVPMSYAYGDGNPTLNRKPPTVPVNLSLSSKTATSVVLAWDASTDDFGVDHYNVFQDNAKVAERVNPGATISGLTTATTYAFKVSAVDKRGNESAKSSALSVTTS